MKQHICEEQTMKTNKNNEIVSATVKELEKQWKNGEWDTVYTFEEYLKIQKNNGIERKGEK